MKSIHTQVEIDAPADDVWRVLVDFPQYTRWNPFVRRLDGEARAGTRLEVRIEPPGGRAMTFRPTVTVVEEGRVLEWLGRVVLPGLFDGRHRFEIVPMGEARCRFVQSETFRGLLVPLVWRRMEATTRRGFHAMNAALKDQVEVG